MALPDQFNEISLDQLSHHIDLMLQRKHTGRTIVDMSVFAMEFKGSTR